MAEIRISLLKIVSLGSKLAATLDTTLTSQRHPEERLVGLNSNINATVGILKQLHDLVEADKQIQSSDNEQVTVLKLAGIREIERRAAECEILYKTTIAIVTKSAGGNGGKKKVKTQEINTSVLKSTGISRGFSWSWLGPRVKKCSEQLEVIKLNLLLVLQVGALAKHQVCISSRVPGMFEEELALRILVENLKRRRYRKLKGLAKKYHVSPPSTANSSVVELVEPSLTRDDKVLLRLCRYPMDILPPWDWTRTQFQKETGMIIDEEALRAWHNRLNIKLKGKYVDLSGVLMRDTKTDDVESSNEDDKIEVVLMSGGTTPPPYTETSAANKTLPIAEKVKPIEPPAEPSDTIFPPPPPPPIIIMDEKKTETPLAPKEVKVLIDTAIKDKSKDVELITMSTFKHSFGNVNSWFKELFGPSSLFFDDKESDSLEALMILGNKGKLRVPFGHRRLKFGLKKMMKAKKTTLLDDYQALPKHLNDAIHHLLCWARIQDSRSRVVVCFDVLKLSEKVEDQHLIVFLASNGPPLEHIRFTDAVGRKFSLPFYLVNSSWEDMRDIINSAFLYVEILGPLVQQGFYDILNESGEIILPKCWASMVKPGMKISMHMWPVPTGPPRPAWGGPRPFGCGPPPRPGGLGSLPPPPPPPLSGPVPGLPATVGRGPIPFRPMPPVSSFAGPPPPPMRKRRSYNTITTTSSTSTDSSELNSCSDIENEECDLGIKFDWEAEMVEANVQMKELLVRWTNAVDVEWAAWSTSSSSSSSGNSSSTSLADD